MLNKLFKLLIIVLLVLGLGFGLLYYTYNKPLPQGVSGPEADALAYRMLDALHFEKYNNSQVLEWAFRDEHIYSWNKTKATVQIKWDSYNIDLDLISPSSSIAYKDDVRLSYEESQDLIEKAIGYFNNDSFWLVAPFKVFDAGTERYLVDLEDGSEGLLVTYKKGGDTPGDSYLWILEPSGKPKSFQMWVNVIPIGGLEASWNDWKETETGALLPTSHSIGPFTISMGTVNALP
ncbi:hypothetical protein Q2T41_00755 [Maribacter confluentis]|uniref:Uncharacterized protein n=1 Tax=Maribacter confluentis TaxID=1656093 RepID=A0ABT8RJF8_9FLAO|nr:hypothetical protein [Maribacter confluentis]MDO1511191.1 hypothetical protein [Maribacter confluentis]